MTNRYALLIMLSAVLLAACAPSGPSTIQGGAVATVLPVTAIPGGATEAPAPPPQSPTPISPLPSGGSPTDLKYLLLENYPDLFFCDPDSYPVARADEMQLALEQFADLQANTEEFRSILAHNGISDAAKFTDEQKLLIYREHKRLAAIVFEASGDSYRFELRTSDGQQGFAIKGLIDGGGRITVQEKVPSLPVCPICLAAWTSIDTPAGAVRISDLKAGDLVWTMNARGERVAAPILQVGSAPVPPTHMMIHVRLSDGRELWGSPGHPTADGRMLSDLRIGDMLDGGTVVLAERATYAQSATYDLLPSGDTGWYWANGILLGSTLAEH